MHKIPTVGVSAQDHKLAALLFDRIVPTHSSSAVPDDVKLQHPALAAFGKREGADREIVEVTKAAEREAQARPESWVGNIITGIPPDQLERFRGDGLSDRRIAVLDVAVVRIRNRHTAKIHEVLAVSGIRSVPLFRSSSAYDMFFDAGTCNAVEVTLANAPIIDTTDLEWDTILAIRCDKEFARRLRDFRLFINRNYKDKEAGEVLDDLNRKLEDYEKSCRANGLKLVLGTFRQMLDSRCLLSALGVAALGAATGMPLEGVVAGVAIEIGKVAISLAERKLSLSESARWGELAYLAAITSAVNKPPGSELHS